MRSFVTVLTPATSRALATLDRIKLELGICDTSSDLFLREKIDDVSAVIEAYLGYRLGRETVRETFRADAGDRGRAVELILSRCPVGNVTAIMIDGTAVDSESWQVDGETGEIFRVSDAGSLLPWYIGFNATVTYTTGFLLPGQPNADLNPAIEGAALSLMKAVWFARGRDPMMKSEEVDGIGARSYWVGGIGQQQLPPEVTAMLDPFRRVSVA